MSDMMEESSTSPGSPQTRSPTHQNNTESTAYSQDSDMSKRHNHFTYDRPGVKNCWNFLRLPKVSLISLKRSWNLKLLLLTTVALMSTICFYSGVVPSLMSSFPSSHTLRHSDDITIPRIAIDLRRRDGGNHKFETEQESDDSDEANKSIPKGEKRFPSSIIFGVSKCGTRAVLEYLKLHPDVVAPMAEINFFNNETLFHKGAKWYLEQMPYARRNQMIVEKSPDYFQNPECAPMIRRMNSTIKLLLLLRNPVERLVSQYMQLLAKNPSLPRFEQWVMHPVSEEVNANIRSVMVSAYAKYLETWLNVFPDDQILIIESDNLRRNPLSEMKRVESFLHLKPYFEASDFYFNSTRGFYCLRYRLTGRSKCLGKSKGRQHIAVEEGVLKRLRMFYNPYNKRLNELLGVQFTWS